MGCQDCDRHVKEAGGYRWLLDQVRERLPHEFDNCLAREGGPNAMAGCLRCAADRLYLMSSPAIAVAAGRQHWLEQSVNLLALLADPALALAQLGEVLERARQIMGAFDRVGAATLAKLDSLRAAQTAQAQAQTKQVEEARQRLEQPPAPPPPSLTPPARAVRPKRPSTKRPTPARKTTLVSPPESVAAPPVLPTRPRGQRRKALGDLATVEGA